MTVYGSVRNSLEMIKPIQPQIFLDLNTFLTQPPPPSLKKKCLSLPILPRPSLKLFLLRSETQLKPSRPARRTKRMRRMKNIVKVLTQSRVFVWPVARTCAYHWLPPPLPPFRMIQKHPHTHIHTASTHSLIANEHDFGGMWRWVGYD